MLTDGCGPHCGLLDGIEGHCAGCHEVRRLIVLAAASVRPWDPEWTSTPAACRRANGEGTEI